MMRKLFFALMAVAAIALTGCEKSRTNEVEPNPPENGTNMITCTCCNKYYFSLSSDIPVVGVGAESQPEPDYKVYASGKGECGRLYLIRDKYPFVTYKENSIDKGYFFWRCECGRYHKVVTYDGTHTEIAFGQQPEEWNRFNYLWE